MTREMISPPLASVDSAALVAGELPEILVVDDNAANLLAMEATLDQIGARVVTARSGPQALRCLLEREVALIILDVQMPAMGGFETARVIRMRERCRYTPIIFVTAYGRNETDIRRAYELGAVDFLFKPVVAEVLQAKVKVFLELHRRSAEVARQAELLRCHEREENQRRLHDERKRWEAAALRRQMEEERRHRAELERVNAQLAAADRRKDEFLAVLAHELRNPLTPLAAGLELWSSEQLDRDQLSRTRDAMVRQLHHLRRLVDDLLDLQRINSDRIELRRATVDARAAIQEAISIAQPLVDGRQQQLTVELPETPLWVDGDPVRLSQIVCNLLSNAARYSDPQGRIDVRAGLLRQDNAEAVVIRVADHGRGIEPEMLDRVFEMFAQSQPGEGLGLGLTLVSRLVELHGGSVEARSEGRGRGSEFIVRLPAVPAPARQVAPSDELIAAWEAQLPPLRVVIVDDNEDIRVAMRDLLDAWGQQVEVASCGAEALERIRARQPDIAFVDIGLPDMDGYTVAERLRSDEEGSRTPVRLIALTGFGQSKDRDRALKAGFDEHLVKPPNLTALHRLLQDAASALTADGR